MNDQFSGLCPTGACMAVALGLQCDCCSKNRGESVFMVCGRCSLAHYCSVQCQRKAWKEHGHKMVCRKEGEFRVGDVAGSSISFGILSVCHPVRLIARADVQEDGGDNNYSTSQSSWQVESTLEDDGNGAKLVKTMSSANLVRIRPVLWCIKNR
jgi:MYND finger